MGEIITYKQWSILYGYQVHIRMTCSGRESHTTNLPPHALTPSRPLCAGNRVVCSFTNWAWRRAGAQYAPENVDPSLCTHVTYQYAVLDTNSLTLETFDEWTDFDNSEYTGRGGSSE